MASSRRNCINYPNTFCFICGECTFKDQRIGISEFVQREYLAYFGVKLGEQDKPQAPHSVCKPVSNTYDFGIMERRRILSSACLEWRQQKNHYDDCYFVWLI